MGALVDVAQAERTQPLGVLSSPRVGQLGNQA